MQLSFQLCKRQISVFRRLLDELYCNYYRKQRLLSVAHVCILPVADPEILRGGRNTMSQPCRKLSQVNNMQFVFAICYGVLAEPEHINCRNNEHSHYFNHSAINYFKAKKLSLCRPLKANLSITSAASTGIVSACT